MQARILEASKKEVSLSITESDIGTLYIIQHELLKFPEVDFAGVIVKHPLTNEIWMRVSCTSGDPLKHMAKAAEAAAAETAKIKKTFESKIKVKSD